MLSTDGFVATTSCSNCCCVGDSPTVAGSIFLPDNTPLSGVICVTDGMCIGCSCEVGV